MNKMKAIWEKGRFILLLIGCILLCFGFIFAGISRMNYKENADYLQEVYGYVNNAFTTRVSRNWNLLSGWSVYLEHAMRMGEDEEVEEFLKECQQKWGFEDFYFWAENGDYISSSGVKGRFDLADKIVNEDGHAIVGVELEDGTELTIFAESITPNKYRGFSYEIVGIGYENKVLENMLNLPDYEGIASCHVVYPNGQILFSVSPFSNNLTNYITFLEDRLEKNSSTMKLGDYEQLKQSVQTGTDGVFKVRLDDTDYYLVYQGMEFQNWGLIGVVPVNSVNADMSHIQWTLVGVLTLLFLIVIVVGALYLQNLSNQKVHKKELALMRQEQMFSILVNGTTDVFVMFSIEDLAVEYASPNVEEILGISVEELYQDIRGIMATAVSEGELSYQELINIPLGENRQVVRERVHQKNGERRWFQETVYHYAFEDTDKYILVMSERTREMNTQKQMQTAFELAKSANEAKSVFLSNMSHDIRTPINAIIGFSLLLSQDAENAGKVKEYTRKIISSSKHLLNLINDVLDMSKIESGKATLNVVEFQLGTLLEDINIVVLPQTKAKKQTFDLRVRGIYDDRLMGDPMRIQQILMNLLTNAVKYTGEGGHIELVVSQEGASTGRFAHLCFQVIDNGIGISKEYMQTMFDAFSREANTTHSGVQGVGLGLSITKSLVDLMGGTIKVESEKGVGTTFTVNLDLMIADAQIEEDFWQKYHIQKILTVDDEKALCLDIQNILSRLGLKVDYATDAESAIQMAERAMSEKEPYDLILLDWFLKDGVNSLETARHIFEKIDKDVFVMAMTAYDWSEFEEKAYAAGVDGFIHKPFFVSNLCQAIKKIQRKVVQSEKRIEEHVEEHVDETDLWSIEGLHILAAEDNDLNAEILNELLELEGATCDLAENGQIALEKFRGSEPGHYDFILMDIQMPVMDGHNATQAIRRCGHPESSTIPIAAMTANAFAEDVKNSLDSGMNAHIGKPIDMDVVKKTITELVSQRNENDEKTGSK